MGPIGELLGKPLGWIMYWIYEVVNNYGFSIIIFTLLTKIILLPISYKQQLGTVRMQALNPKLSKLRKQYANNQQKLAEEQQKLYAEEGVNPMGSCLPLIISDDHTLRRAGRCLPSAFAYSQNFFRNT